MEEYIIDKNLNIQDAIDKEHDVSCSSSAVDVALMMPFLDRFHFIFNSFVV